MKKRPISLNRKLLLHKETIAPLNNDHQSAVFGGATATDKGCMGSGQCDIRYTGPALCAPVTENDLCCQLTRFCPVQTDLCQ